MIKHSPLLLSGRSNRPFARRVAKELGLHLSPVEIVRFSDSELRVTILDHALKGRDIFCIQPTNAPTNEHIMELLLLIHAAQSLQPKRIIAVMPFFGYRRQEKVTQPGESLSFQLVARLLRAAGVSRVITMDLHKHRSAKFFAEAGIGCKELRAFDTIIQYFRNKNLKNFVVVAPDKGGIPESERYAASLGVPLVKISKHRSRTRLDSVTFHRFEGNVKGKNIFIVDDEINTAGTLLGVVDILKKKKAKNIYVAATHGVLSGPAIERLVHARIHQIIVTDTIFLSPKKRIKKIHILSVADVFAKAMK